MGLECILKQNLRSKHIQLIICLHARKLIISLTNSSRLENCVSSELCLLDMKLHTSPAALSLNSHSRSTSTHADSSEWAISTR